MPTPFRPVEYVVNHVRITREYVGNIKQNNKNNKNNMIVHSGGSF